MMRAICPHPRLARPSLARPGLARPHLARTLSLGLALLALGACAGRPAPTDEPVPPAQAACRSEARSDPAVVSLNQQMNPLNLGNQNRLSHEIRVAELRAFRDCLRRNGLAAPGGVEAVRPQ